MRAAGAEWAVSCNRWAAGEAADADTIINIGVEIIVEISIEVVVVDFIVTEKRSVQSAPPLHHHHHRRRRCRHRRLRKSEIVQH